MDVILLEDVEKLGLRGDVVSVARGYARNFLLPRKLAEPATPARVAELERIEAGRARHEARSAEQANEIAEVLSKTVLRFEVKAGPTGALFGSVTPSDVADEIWRTRKVRVDRRKVAIDPIKRIGRYSVPIELFQDVQVELKTLVVPEGGELPPEEELEAAREAEEAAEREAAEREAAEHRAAAEAMETAEAQAAAEAEAEAAAAEAAIAEVIAEEEEPEELEESAVSEEPAAPESAEETSAE
jgi:large subunit ribosomal protein L9